MRSFGSDVSDLDEPVSANLMLNREVPLLGCGCDPVERNLEADEAVYVAGEGGAALLRVGRRVSVPEGAGRRKALEERSLGYESRTQHAEGRNPGESRGRVGLEEIGQAARSREEVDRDGKEWRGK